MNIFLIGKPGSGKGTITQYLQEEGFIQLSTGDLLRKEIATESPLGKEISLLLKDGNFATDEMIFNLVNKFLEENQDKSIIFDGFPRNLPQMKKCMEMNIKFDHIFHLDVPDEVLQERIVNRRVHLASGRVYNLKTMPPKVEGLDDITGEPLIHRDDDKEGVLSKRLENYQKLTKPIIQYLQENDIQVTVIDGTSPIQDQVRLIRAEIEDIKMFNLLKEKFEKDNLNIPLPSHSYIKNKP